MEILAAKAHRSYLCYLHIFYLHHVLDKIPMWKLFMLITLREKIKSRKKSLGKVKKKKNRPKEERNISILPKKDLTKYLILVKSKFVIHKVKTRFPYNTFASLDTKT